MGFKALRKKNVLVEKPAFIDFEKSKLIFNIRTLTKFFGEGFMYRYHPQLIKICEIIKENQIGKII